MGTVAKSSGNGDYKPAPAGNHIARCIRVIDLGTQKGSVQFPDPKHKIMLAWELCEEKVEIEGVMTPMVVTKDYTLSLHKKAGLRRDLESWRGCPFTEEEQKGFDVAKLIDQPAMINIIHVKSQDGAKTYANVSSIAKVPKSMRDTTPTAHHELIHYQIEDGMGDGFKKLPQWVRDKIMKSEELSGPSNTNGADQPPPHDDDDLPF